MKFSGNIKVFDLIFVGSFTLTLFMGSCLCVIEEEEAWSSMQQNISYKSSTLAVWQLFLHRIRAF